MRRIFLLLLILMLLPGGVLAQGDDEGDPPNQFFTTDGSLSIQMPTNWRAEQAPDYVVMSSSLTVIEEGVPTPDNPWIIIFLPDRYSDVIDNFTDYDDPEELANALHDALESDDSGNVIGEVTPVDAEENELGGFSLTTSVPEENVEGLFRIFDLGDGKLSIAMLATVDGQIDAFADIYEAVLGTIRYNPPVAASYISPGVGVEFDYPPEWDIDGSQDFIVGLASSREALRGGELVSGEVSVVIFKADTLQIGSDEEAEGFGETPVEIAENFLKQLFGLDTDDETESIESGELELEADYPAAYARSEIDDADGYIIAIDLGEEEGVLIIFAATPPDEIDAFEEDLLFIAESVEVYVQTEQ